MEQAIKDSLDCYKICLETISYCIKKGGKHADFRHLQILKDCAEVCNLNASFMIRNSVFHGDTAELCADICEKCALSCEAVDPEDTQMQACAKMCRQCAKSCKEMEEKMDL